MEDLLKQIKDSPYYAEIAKKLTDSEIKDFLKEYSAKNGMEVDSEGGVMITPVKGYVVKTFDANSNEKVFINMCSHEIVDMPEQKDVPEADDQLALRVPLSLGQPRPDHDRSGKICTIYDVVVNPNILEKSQEDPNMRHLLIELCVSHIAQKHKQQLSMKYHLPKLKYKGTLQQQRVRGKKDPKIQVIDKEVFETPIETTRTPSWKILLDNEEFHVETLKDFKEFEITVELELLVTGRSINLRCGEERVELTVGKIYGLSLWTPFKVEVSSVSGTFDCNTRKLSVKGRRKQDIEEVPEINAKLTPVSLSSNDLLFDVV